MRKFYRLSSSRGSLHSFAEDSLLSDPNPVTRDRQAVMGDPEASHTAIAVMAGLGFMFLAMSTSMLLLPIGPLF